MSLPCRRRRIRRIPARLILVAGALLGSIAYAAGQDVWEREGYIYSGPKDHPHKLTKSGLDSAPVLSPDRKTIAYIRATPGKEIPTGSGKSEVTQLWIMQAAGGNPRMLLQGVESKDAKGLLAEFQAPQFSPDGGSIYFLSAAYATSGAVHVVGIRAAKEHFVCPGNSLEVIRAGEYTGDLIVQQHRYFLGAGSYDWYWLLRPDGRDLGPIGEDAANFRELYLEK